MAQWLAEFTVLREFNSEFLQIRDTRRHEAIRKSTTVCFFSPHSLWRRSAQFLHRTGSASSPNQSPSTH